MKTSEFLNLLKEHSGKSLYFEYTPGKRVGNHYHITEVKNISIDAVDCGGRSDKWKETVIQLWETPAEAGKDKPMSAYKAQSILNRVHQIRPMDLEAPVKFEYGIDNFHTAQLPVQAAYFNEEELLIQLTPDITDCKAKDACGVPATAEVAAAEAEGGCTPGSGCC